MTAAKSLVVCACALALASCENMSQRETTGSVVGGALGTLIGAQFGSGGGKVAMAGLGLALGAYTGKRIGRHMDADAAAAHDKVAQQALWNSPQGKSRSWKYGKTSGQITPTSSAYKDGSGRSCRRFTDSVTFEDGKQQVVSGVACANADGQWVVSEA